MRDIAGHLSTPIEAIDQQLHELKQGVSEKEKEILENSLKKVKGFVERLNDIIHAKKIYENIQVFDPCFQIKQNLSYIQTLAQKNDISFDHSLDSQSLVSFNIQAFDEIVMNLVGNAIKYRRLDVKSEVKLSTSIQDQFFVMRVKDNGLGIKEENIPHLFNRFYRVEGADVQGTGLGLAFCKEMLQDSGGYLSVESSYGSGSVFSVYIPLVKKPS